jgi:hypothetical protein
VRDAHFLRLAGGVDHLLPRHARLDRGLGLLALGRGSKFRVPPKKYAAPTAINPTTITRTITFTMVAPLYALGWMCSIRGR